MQRSVGTASINSKGRTIASEKARDGAFLEIELARAKTSGDCEWGNETWLAAKEPYGVFEQGISKRYSLQYES